MNVTKLKPAALAVVAMATLLALGACGKKVDDATTVPMTPAPESRTPADTSSPVTGTTSDSGNAANSGNMGSGSVMPPPTPPASASTN